MGLGNVTNTNWKIVFSKKADRDFAKLDNPVQARINDFLMELLEKYPDPRTVGKPLTGDLSNLWRYRVGDYRIVASIQDSVMQILVVRVNHRRDVYY